MPRARTISVVLTTIVTAIACSYDWSKPGLGLQTVDSGDLDTGTGTETSPRVDGGGPLTDASSDQEVPLTCVDIEGEIRMSQARARRCPVDASTCDHAVKDACGCDTYVADRQSQEVITWQGWILRFNQQRCPEPETCETCPIVLTSVCRGDPPDRSCAP